MDIAIGKYLIFIDNDDALTKTALEELYTAAKNFDADVVACEKWFTTAMNGNISTRNLLKIVAPPTIKFVCKPTILTDDINKRLNLLNNLKLPWNVWTKLIRRDFLIDNNIRFIRTGFQDVTFTCSIVCAAKKYVLVPNVVNIYRIHSNSISHAKPDSSKLFKSIFISFNEILNYANEFLSNIEPFKNNYEIKLMATDTFTNLILQRFLRFYQSMSKHQIDEIVSEAIVGIEKDTSNLTTFLFRRMNIFYLNLIQQQQIQRLQSQLKEVQK